MLLACLSFFIKGTDRRRHLPDVQNAQQQQNPCGEVGSAPRSFLQLMLRLHAALRRIETLRRLGSQRSLFSGSTQGLCASIKHRVREGEGEGQKRGRQRRS